MVRFLIHRPIAVFMTFLALVLLGVFAINRLPISLLPEISIPEITVEVTAPGLGPEEAERVVAAPLRQMLQQVPGIVDISSETGNNRSTIRLSFSYGSNIDLAFNEVNEKIDMVLPGLPKDLPRPRVVKASASDLPVFYLYVSFSKKEVEPQDMLDLSQLTSTNIRRRLEQLPEVGLVDMSGLTTPELCITPNEDAIKSLGITRSEIGRMLQENNIPTQSIQLKEGVFVYNVLLDHGLKTPEDVSRMPITINGRVFLLQELATVTVKPQRTKGMVVYNGKPSIAMAIIKQASGKVGDVKESAVLLISDLKKEYPSLEFTLSQDQTLLLDYTLSNLKSSLIAGIILAIGAMFFFLSDIKSPLLIALTIPVSLVISLLFFHLLGISLNIVSLSGLILGVGMMVDNSIVVIDNILQVRSRGQSREESVVLATNEVIRPLLSSMFTTCAVFIPLVFLSGIAGALFYDQAMAITIGLMASFWVSITLLPTAFFAFGNSSSKESWISKITQHRILHLEDKYEATFLRFFRHRRWVTPIVIAFIALAPLMFIVMEKEKMPKISRTDSIVKVSWNEDIGADENRDRLAILTKVIGSRANEVIGYLGEQQFLLNREMDQQEAEAYIYVNANSAAARVEVEKLIFAKFKRAYPYASVKCEAPATVFERIFPESEADFVLQLNSREQNGIPTVTEVRNLYDTLLLRYPNAAIAQPSTQAQVFLKLKPEALLLHGVDRSTIVNEIKAAFGYGRVGEINLENRVIPINVSYNQSSLSDLLNTHFIKNTQGIPIPIKTFIEEIPEVGYKSIDGSRGKAYIPLIVNFPGKIDDDFMVEVAAIAKEKDLMVAFTGGYFSNKKMTNELSIVLIISVLLLYFILAAQFESLLQPLIVLLEIPIDIGGALLILWLVGASINLMSMIGLVVMGGIIVNDSILKIDTINRLRLEGYGVMEAISIGGLRRLKPIIMTSLTTMLAMIPILFGNDIGSELQQPLAWTTIGGMTIGTIVSLFVIPLLYWAIYHKKDKYSK